MMNAGPLGRIGRWSHGHRFAVIGAWAVIAVGLGAFAPRLESALSGAMWEVRGSESLEARQVIEREFGGLSSQWEGREVVVRRCRTNRVLANIDDGAPSLDRDGSERETPARRQTRACILGP